MKIRTGFVSNSSSSSFVFALPSDILADERVRISLADTFGEEDVEACVTELQAIIASGSLEEDDNQRYYWWMMDEFEYFALKRVDVHLTSGVMMFVDYQDLESTLTRLDDYISSKNDDEDEDDE